MLPVPELVRPREKEREKEKEREERKRERERDNGGNGKRDKTTIFQKNPAAIALQTQPPFLL